jgi:hypothetical protein
LEKRTVGRSRLGELTAFLRHYFALLSGVLVNEEHVYSRFRDRGQAMSVTDFERELHTVKRFAGYYDRLLRPTREPDKEVRQQLERLAILESATAFPFLLYMYDEWEQARLHREEFLAGLRLIETYMVRRFLNRDLTSYINRMFPTLIKDVKERGEIDFTKALRKALGSRNEPSDVRLRQSAETLNLYGGDKLTRQKLALIFDGINRRLSEGSGAYTVLSDDPTIEHIMPQTLTDAWKHDLGETWQQDYALLHTLGNLTVVTQEWNSQLSNGSYASKHPKLAGHGLMLNQVYFRDYAPSHWNSDAIRKRAQWLIGKTTEIWPQLSDTGTYVEEKAKAVIILGDVYPVYSWRDVLRRSAEFAAQWCNEKFEDQVIAKRPSYFSREATADGWYPLQNGWRVYVNLSADAIKQLSASIIEAAGIPQEEFDVVLW